MKEGKAKSRKTKGGLHSEGTLDTVSREIRVPLLEDKREGEANILSPHGKKRAASEGWEEKAPKRGKMPLSGSSGLEDDVVAQSHSEDKPLAKS